MDTVTRLKQRARELKREVIALYFACRDPRTPWYARAFAAAVVAYALSPIDLIPDFVPVLGYLDDLVIIPGGMLIALRLIPASVLAESRERARLVEQRPTSRAGAVMIAAVWVLAAIAAGYMLARAADLI